jgi:hypothetical protein
MLCATVVSLAACGTIGRETDHLVWAERGQEVGKRMNLYCVQGSHHQREQMMAALQASAYPATVTITCPDQLPKPTAPAPHGIPHLLPPSVSPR